MSAPVITYEQLRKAGACRVELDLFKRKFGESVEVTVELAESVASEFDWGWAAANLLNATAGAKYKRATAAAWAEYKRATAAAGAEYERATAAAWAEYERATAAAWAEYERATAPAGAKYKRARAAAWAEYGRAKAPAFATAYINQGGAA